MIVRPQIDLRSDTITKPSKGMLDAMMSAEVGDDVFGDDPTVNELQARLADMFGMEAALFCPSGTMTNQIALRVLSSPQDEVICDKRSHIYLYEGGGIAYNSMLSAKLLDGDRGRLTAKMVEENVSQGDIYAPPTRIVSLENTMNKCGGSIYDLEEIKKIRMVCDKHSIKLHMDGARFFNALVETKDDSREYGQLLDTISICFSKGLGAPVGSVLLGSKATIAHAMRVRKVLGGGMRQAGYLAAACIYALDHNIERLTLDHRRARFIGEALVQSEYVKEVLPVDTNIVIAYLDPEKTSTELYLDKLSQLGILGVPFGNDSVRFVTHLDLSEEDLQKIIDGIDSIG
ncbi:MAG: aminotransferase class I/II-fold pyridoxal phosphate-dependent enzyme [Cyclobacteriaceae bacterium]